MVLYSWDPFRLQGTWAEPEVQYFEFSPDFISSPFHSLRTFQSQRSLTHFLNNPCLNPLPLPSSVSGHLLSHLPVSARTPQEGQGMLSWDSKEPSDQGCGELLAPVGRGPWRKGCHQNLGTTGGSITEESDTTGTRQQRVEEAEKTFTDLSFLVPSFPAGFPVREPSQHLAARKPWVPPTGLHPPEHRADWGWEEWNQGRGKTEKPACLCRTYLYLKYSDFFGCLVSSWLSSPLERQLCKERGLSAWPLWYP